jgi:hypothetical protein
VETQQLLLPLEISICSLVILNGQYQDLFRFSQVQVLAVALVLCRLALVYLDRMKVQMLISLLVILQVEYQILEEEVFEFIQVLL